jgi:hypothetical protein
MLIWFGIVKYDALFLEDIILKNRKKNHKKPPSTIILVASIVILLIARNIDITNIGDMDFGIKQLTYIIILLLSIAAIGYILKQRD